MQTVILELDEVHCLPFLPNEVAIPAPAEKMKSYGPMHSSF